MNNDLENKLKELKKGYINKLRESIPTFKSLLAEEPININEIYSKVHTISGTSGMYGLKDLSDVSTKFEIYLKPFKDEPNTVDAEILKAKLSDYIDYLEKTV